MTHGQDGTGYIGTRDRAARLAHAYEELAVVLESTDLDRDELFAEAVIDALEAADRAYGIETGEDVTARSTGRTADSPSATERGARRDTARSEERRPTEDALTTP